MSTPRLSRRIREASLSPAVAAAFAAGLSEVIVGQSNAEDPRRLLIERLVGPVNTAPAPFEALWPWSELFLSACLTVALADGNYRTEEARVVSAFAHRLGLGARQLAMLESKVFQEIRERGAARIARQEAADGVDLFDAPDPPGWVPGEEQPENDDLTEPVLST